MSALGLVVQVVEVSTEALVEDGGATKSESVVCTNREACGVDGAGLRGPIELELAVVGNISSPGLRILQDSVLKSQDESAVSSTGSHALQFS